jgi:tetratricopeptide (TPR) repeat protein
VGTAAGTENAVAATNVALTSTAVRQPSLLARLFGAKPKPEEGGAESASGAAGSGARVTPLPAAHGPLHYAAPAVSTNPGNRVEAVRLAREGAAADKESRWKEAMDSYEAAVKADPSYYEACEALGMAAIKSGEYGIALEALHHGLALNAESANARYAYAWVLQKEDYFQDAANELERLLRQHPDEIRAHLLLGNLYAQNLGQPDFARGHYKTVLEKDPRNDQAPALRAWLQNNPEP